MFKNRCFINFLKDDNSSAISVVRYFKSIAKHTAYLEHNLVRPNAFTGILYIARNKQAKDQVHQLRKEGKFNGYIESSVSRSKMEAFEDYATSDNFKSGACRIGRWVGCQFGTLNIIIDDFFNFPRDIQHNVHKLCSIAPLYVKHELNIYVYSTYKVNDKMCATYWPHSYEYFLSENYIEIHD